MEEPPIPFPVNGFDAGFVSQDFPIDGLDEVAAVVVAVDRRFHHRLALSVGLSHSGLACEV